MHNYKFSAADEYKITA